jgi:hypothetical protein
LQVKFHYIAAKLARKGKNIYAYRILAQKPEGKDHLEDVGVDERIMLKFILNKWDGRLRTGLIWFRIGTSGGLFWTRKWTIWFHKIVGISWIAEKLRTFRQELCFMEFFWLLSAHFRSCHVDCSVRLCELNISVL